MVPHKCKASLKDGHVLSQITFTIALGAVSIVTNIFEKCLDSMNTKG